MKWFMCVCILIGFTKCDDEITDVTNTHAILNIQNKEPIEFIAIFLLSSLNMATQFGEERNEGHGNTGIEVFTRIRASQKTWAHHVKHF